MHTDYKNNLIIFLIIMILIIYYTQTVEKFENTAGEYFRKSYPPKLYCPVESTFENNFCNTKTCNKNLKYNTTLNKCLVEEEYIPVENKFLFFPCATGKTEINGKCYTKPNNYICGTELNDKNQLLCWVNTVNPINKEPLKICDERQVLENGVCYDKPLDNYSCTGSLCKRIISSNSTTNPNNSMIPLENCEEVILLTNNRIIPGDKEFIYSLEITAGMLSIKDIRIPAQTSDSTSMSTEKFIASRFKLCNIANTPKEIKILITESGVVGVDKSFAIVYFSLKGTEEQFKNFIPNILTYNTQDRILSVGNPDSGEFIFIDNNTIYKTADKKLANIFITPSTSQIFVNESIVLDKIKDYVAKLIISN